MKSIYLIFTFFIIIVFNLNGQDIKDIKSNSLYIWGEGVGKTLKQADKEALSMLIDQIQVQVKSNFEQQQTEQNGKIDEKVKSIIQTYSNATLTNTERIVESNEPEAKVLRFIKRSELSKIFAERKNKIIEFARNGINTEKNLQIADALRYYYWSLTLLNSHPEGNGIDIKDENGSIQLLKTWLPFQINNIFANLKISIASVKNEQNLTTAFLKVKYKTQIVQNFDYSYWDGRDWSNIVSAKDGNGIVELTGNVNAEEIKLKAEYIFEGESAIDNELHEVIETIDAIPFRNSFITVTKNVEETKTFASLTTDTKANHIEENFTEITNKTLYESAMTKIQKAIQNQQYDTVRSLFTSDGFIVFQKLVKYGQAKIISEPKLRYLKHENGIICRSLPMRFKFKNNDRIFMEDVVFYFNETGMVTNLTFGLSKNTIGDIASKELWNEKVRMTLINFLENYKTAYALKRDDYIQNIFADDALIIIGSVLKVATTPETNFMSNQIVKYNRYSKEEYLKKLRHSFASNEFINIKFENCEVRKSGKGDEIYGIQIKQDYFSANYGDKGYLFLLLDISNPEQPTIHVRTWQPEKSADGSIYGLSDF
jgi:hypothetical protein